MSNQSPTVPFGPRADEYALGAVAQAIAQRATNQSVTLSPEQLQRLGISRRHQRAIGRLASTGGRPPGWLTRLRGRGALHAVGRAVAAEVMAPTQLGDPRDTDPDRLAVETSMRRGLPRTWTDNNVNEAIAQLPWAQAARHVRPRFLSVVFDLRSNDRIAVEAAARAIVTSAAAVDPSVRMNKEQVLGRLLRSPERTQEVVSLFAGEPEGQRHGARDPRRQAGADFAKRYRKGPERWALRVVTIAGPVIGAAAIAAGVGGAAVVPWSVAMVAGAALNLRGQLLERAALGARRAALQLGQEVTPPDASLHGNDPGAGAPQTPPATVAAVAVVQGVTQPGRQAQAPELRPDEVLAGQRPPGSGAGQMQAGERPPTTGTGQRGQQQSID